MGKVSIVSHRADLDGVASAILATEFVMARRGQAPDQVLFADYDDVKTVIARAAIDAEELWILDLSIKEPNIAEFFKHIPKDKVFFFDHHGSSKSTVHAWENSATIFFDDSGNSCAADLAYAAAAELAPTFVKTPAYNHLVAATHSRDLWINDTLEGALLSDVISVLGAQAAYDGLIEQPTAAFESNFPKIFQEAVSIARQQRETALTMVRNTMISLPRKGGNIIYALTTGYQSEVADMLLKDEPSAYVILFNIGHMGASIRCTPETIASSGITASQLAAMFPGGGGHPMAAGFQLPADFGHVIMHSGCTSVHSALTKLFK